MLSMYCMAPVVLSASYSRSLKSDPLGLGDRLFLIKPGSAIPVNQFGLGVALEPESCFSVPDSLEASLELSLGSVEPHE